MATYHSHISLIIEADNALHPPSQLSLHSRCASILFTIIIIASTLRSPHPQSMFFYSRNLPIHPHSPHPSITTHQNISLCYFRFSSPARRNDRERTCTLGTLVFPFSTRVSLFDLAFDLTPLPCFEFFYLLFFLVDRDRFILKRSTKFRVTCILSLPFYLVTPRTGPLL